MTCQFASRFYFSRLLWLQYNVMVDICLCLFSDYTEGAELVDAVLDVVRKEAEGTDCLQGEY